jgi:hypothetical protein
VHAEKSDPTRYQNVGELVEDLKRSLLDPQGDFVVTMAPVASDRVRRFASRTQRSGTGTAPERIKSADDRIRKYSDEENEEEQKGSKLEKGLTIGGFIIGAIIIVILIFVIGNMFNIFHTNRDNSGSSANSVRRFPRRPMRIRSRFRFPGMTVDEATELANKRGIGVRRKATESSDQRMRKVRFSVRIRRQATKVEKSTTVYVTVSTGKAL